MAEHICKSNGTKIQVKNFWADKRLIVTGGRVFLGSFVVKKLQQHYVADIFVPRKAGFELRKRDAIQCLLNKLDIVV